MLSVAGSIFHSLAHIVLLRDARAAGEDRMAASLRDRRGAGRGVVVQGCGVQLGRFQGEVPTAMGGPPAAGVRGSRADGPQEIQCTGRGGSQRICGTTQRETQSRGVYEYM